MKESDAIALAALAVSLVAVGIAFVSLWRTHLRRFRPEVIVGQLRQRIYTIENSGERWHICSFDVPISVTNAGACMGRVLGLQLRLTFPDLPITGNYELLPVEFEIPPSESKGIHSERFRWLDELSVTDWLPFTVLARASVTKHFIFETRWDEPVVQPRMSIQLQMRTSRKHGWSAVAEFDAHLDEGVWAEMIHGGSSFGYNPKGEVDHIPQIHPPDLHKYTTTGEVISDEGVVPPSRQVPPGK